MSVQIIPTSADPFYVQTTQLDGVNYRLDFRYNQREAAWYVSIALDDGTSLVRGIKIVCGVPLLHRTIDPRLPPGVLAAVPNTEDDSPPGLEELGEDRRVSLVYFTADEV